MLHHCISATLLEVWLRAMEQGIPTGNIFGSAEPSPKPTFSCRPYDIIKRNLTMGFNAVRTEREASMNVQLCAKPVIPFGLSNWAVIWLLTKCTPDPTVEIIPLSKMPEKYHQYWHSE